MCAIEGLFGFLWGGGVWCMARGDGRSDRTSLTILEGDWEKTWEEMLKSEEG